MLMQGVSQKDEQVFLLDVLEAIGRKSSNGTLSQGVSQTDEQVLLQNGLEAIGR